MKWNWKIRVLLLQTFWYIVKWNISKIALFNLFSGHMHALPIQNQMKPHEEMRTIPGTSCQRIRTSSYSSVSLWSLIVSLTTVGNLNLRTTLYSTFVKRIRFVLLINAAKVAHCHCFGDANYKTNVHCRHRKILWLTCTTWIFARSSLQSRCK